MINHIHKKENEWQACHSDRYLLRYGFGAFLSAAIHQWRTHPDSERISLQQWCGQKREAHVLFQSTTREIILLLLLFCGYEEFRLIIILKTASDTSVFIWSLSIMFQTTTHVSESIPSFRFIIFYLGDMIILCNPCFMAMNTTLSLKIQDKCNVNKYVIIIAVCEATNQRMSWCH